MHEPPRLFDVAPYELDLERGNGDAGTGRNTTLDGALSERAAIDVMLRLGFKVAVPIVDDDGVDLVVNYRHTVNVKSSRRRGKPGHTWVFNSGRVVYRADGSRRYSTRPPTAGFIICHAVPIDAWWIVPRERLEAAGHGRGDYAFSLSSAPRYRTKYSAIAADCRDAWHLLE